MTPPSAQKMTVRQAFEKLVDLGLAARDQLKRVPTELADAALEVGRVDERFDVLGDVAVTALKAVASGIPVLGGDDLTCDPSVRGLVPAEFVHRYSVVPVDRVDGTVTLAMADPFDLKAVDDFVFLTGEPVRRAFAAPGAIEKAIRTSYGSSVETMVEHLAGPTEDGLLGEEDSESAGHLHEIARDPSIVNLVNLILIEAVQRKASDVHVEPFEKELKLKYRIDGMLHEMPLLPKNLQAGILSRIKIMARMDIAERVRPQDGHIEFVTPDHHRVDLRVATVPTLHGESLVLRILDKSVGLLDIDNLGIPQEILYEIGQLLTQIHGLILVTGPTGSGKTTTLYAALRALYDPSKKIITIEDPVEYELPGVNQIPVLRKREITFARGLRAILRQDPDVIMVGEIRDRETADIAIRSALTGHLVLSTLHTNDAVGAVTRLLDMGIEPFLVASSLEAVVAQRLVRRICRYCAEQIPIEKMGRRHFAEELGIDVPEKVSRGRGCSNCMNTGYSGRVGVFELFRMTSSAQEMVTARASADKIAAAHMSVERTMRYDGFLKIAASVTSIEEVLRVTQSNNRYASGTPD